MSAAEGSGQLVFGAHLAWDQGFGDGWGSSELWGLDRRTARRLLFGTVDAVVRRYRHRVAAWSCANEGIAADGGLRTDVPWFRTCGPDYVATAFHVAHQADPTATLVLNDFGFETSSGASFDAAAYRRFLRELDDRDVRIMITELDVLDTGLPASIRVRDAAVADVYARYLDAVGTAVDVAAVMTFGVSDRYTWLQQDYPRRDGAARRPLPFDQHLRPTRAWRALRDQLAGFEPRRA